MLQATLVDLVDLSLIGKQAHWNVIGKNFRSVHLQLDELVATARQYVDEVAERANSIGVSPNGQAKVVVESSGLPDYPGNWQSVESTVAAIVDILASLIERLRKRVKPGDNDDYFLVFGPEDDCRTAANEIRLRFADATEGVPKETRQALAGGFTTFERILPGPDRMYPDTDSPPTRITEDHALGLALPGAPGAVRAPRAVAPTARVPSRSRVGAQPFGSPSPRGRVNLEPSALPRVPAA